MGRATKPDPFGDVILNELLRPGRQLWKAELSYSGYSGDRPDPVLAATQQQANLIGSLAEDGRHWPVIDIDHPAMLLPSSTEGHYHLYIDKAVTANKYFDMLDAMARAGIVEDGYAKVSRKRKQSFALKPGLRKQEAMF